MTLESLTKLISPKVLAATGGAGLGAVVSPFVIWLVGVLVFGVPGDAIHQAEAMAAVPSVVNSLIIALLAVVGAFVPGWAVTDPARSDDEVPPPPPAVDEHENASGEPADESDLDDAEDDAEDAGSLDDTPENVNGI